MLKILIVFMLTYVFISELRGSYLLVKINQMNERGRFYGPELLPLDCHRVCNAFFKALGREVNDTQECLKDPTSSDESNGDQWVHEACVEGLKIEHLNTQLDSCKDKFSNFVKDACKAVAKHGERYASSQCHSKICKEPIDATKPPGRCDSEYHECKYSNSTDIECCEINEDCLCDQQCLYTPIQTPPHQICSHQPPTGDWMSFQLDETDKFIGDPVPTNFFFGRDFDTGFLQSQPGPHMLFDAYYHNSLKLNDIKNGMAVRIKARNYHVSKGYYFLYSSEGLLGWVYYDLYRPTNDKQIWKIWFEEEGSKVAFESVMWPGTYLSADSDGWLHCRTDYKTWWKMSIMS